jgi:ABC-type uncharacterized transport system ATPase subunit
MTDKIRSMPCVDNVTPESATKLKIIVHGEDAFDNILEQVRSMKGKISSMENLQPTLEDVFLHMTGRNVRDSVEAKVVTPMGGHRLGMRPRGR